MCRAFVSVYLLCYGAYILSVWICATLLCCRVVGSCVFVLFVDFAFEPVEGLYLARMFWSLDSSRHGRGAECNSTLVFS